MESMTNGANTNDWVEATKGLKIFAYIESVRFELAKQPHPMIQGDKNRLKSVSQSWAPQHDWKSS